VYLIEGNYLQQFAASSFGIQSMSVSRWRSFSCLWLADMSHAHLLTLSSLGFGTLISGSSQSLTWNFSSVADLVQSWPTLSVRGFMRALSSIQPFTENPLFFELNSINFFFIL
jgi:hypothetical protein